MEDTTYQSILDASELLETVNNSDYFFGVLYRNNPCLTGSSSNENFYTALRFKDIDRTSWVIKFQVMPTMAIITLLTNSTICAVLSKSPPSTTKFLLMAIACSDLLTVLSPMPWYYFFLSGKYRDWVPLAWCHVYTICEKILPFAFHSCSIWLTVTLALQRLIFIKNHDLASRLCTQKNAAIVAVSLLGCALSFHLIQSFENKVIPCKTYSRIHPDDVIESCALEPAFQMSFYLGYYSCQIIFIHLIPCVTLGILSSLLIRVIVLANRRRSRILSHRQRSVQSHHSMYTTVMLVVLVVVFLIIEVPFGLAYTLRVTGVKSAVSANFFLFATCALHLTFPLNFFLYCSMASEFRQQFAQMLRALFWRCIPRINTQSGGATLTAV